jgi:hypothetical protein
MDPTSLPTDNLYKFLALGSLAAMVFMIYSARKLHSELRMQKRSANLENARHKLLADHLGIALMMSTPPDAEQRVLEVKVRQLEVEHEQKVLAVQSKIVDGALDKTFILIFVFLVSSIVGFTLWYTRFQWFQDQVTHDAWREQRAKTALAEIELDNARKKPATASSATAPPDAVIRAFAGR